MLGRPYPGVSYLSPKGDWVWGSRGGEWAPLAPPLKPLYVIQNFWRVLWNFCRKHRKVKLVCLKNFFFWFNFTFNVLYSDSHSEGHVNKIIIIYNFFLYTFFFFWSCKLLKFWKYFGSASMDGFVILKIFFNLFLYCIFVVKISFWWFFEL